MKSILTRWLLYFGLDVTRLRMSHKVLNLIQDLHPIEYELVRIGGDGDGGYLVPNDLSGITKCFSPGVSDNSSFEKEISERNIHCFLADASVDAPPITNSLISFNKRFVGANNFDQTMSFQQWVQENSNSSDELILQMDIEGGEYSSLLSCNRDILIRFRILVIEFHNLEKMLNQNETHVIEETFRKILEDFRVVHIHPNNSGRIARINGVTIPTIMEFTFLRKDRFKTFRKVSFLPNELDQINSPYRKAITLPEMWYK